MASIHLWGISPYIKSVAIFDSKLLVHISLILVLYSAILLYLVAFPIASKKNGQSATMNRHDIHTVAGKHIDSFFLDWLTA